MSEFADLPLYGRSEDDDGRGTQTAWSGEESMDSSGRHPY